MRYMIGFSVSFLALVIGTTLLTPTKRFDKITSGVYQPRALYCDGVNDEDVLKFTFDINGESFVGMEPLKVLPVEANVRPHVLVFVPGEQSTFGLTFRDQTLEVKFYCGLTEADLAKPGDKSFWVVVNKDEPWIKGLPEKYLLPTRKS